MTGLWWQWQESSGWQTPQRLVDMMITRWAPQGITWPMYLFVVEGAFLGDMGYGDMWLFWESGWGMGGGGGGIWVTVRCMCACAVSWDHTLDWLSHLLCDWTSPCSHVHLQTHTYICTYSLGTHSGHLARPVRIFLHSVWPVDPRQPQASASQHATVAALPLVLCCFTENLRICLVERKLVVV